MKAERLVEMKQLIGGLCIYQGRRNGKKRITDLLIDILAMIESELNRIKHDCELCMHEATEEWTCHIHLGENKYICYTKGQTFELVDDDNLITFTAKCCPNCGRKMEVEE